MKEHRITHALFSVFGCCLLAVSFFTGCTWSAESNNVRINSPPSDDSFDDRGDSTEVQERFSTSE